MLVVAMLAAPTPAPGHYGTLDHPIAQRARTASQEDDIPGHISFFKPARYQNAYEMGFRIYRPENWGRGHVTEAASVLVSYLFETKTVDRIQAAFLAGNETSRRVLESSGFQLEGVLRKAVFHRGQNEDLHLYSILRSESWPIERQTGGTNHDLTRM
jgi:ribosomal-protein-alanine N-acetyltransferase